MCRLFTLVYLVLPNIATISALALSSSSSSNLGLGALSYHETPLHNLQDVSNLGVESNGTRKERLEELREILEDESQSPDEQSPSRYDENVKIFENPAVLEATSHPTEDEVKDFMKVSDHEKASRDVHFDSLQSLVGNFNLLDSLKSNFLGTPNSAPSKLATSWSPNNPQDSSPLKSLSPENSASDSENSENPKPLPSNPLGPNPLGSNPLSALGSNPLSNPLTSNLLKDIKLPPVTVHAPSHNTFHVVNVHHHHHPDSNSPGSSGSTLSEVNPHSSPFATRECFETSFKGHKTFKECYCSRDPKCRCTKTFIMLSSLCSTLLHDPDLGSFCSHDGNNLNSDLNYGNSNPQDHFVFDAFTNVQNALCNSKSQSYCRGIFRMEKLCDCTRCD